MIMILIIQIVHVVFNIRTHAKMKIVYVLVYVRYIRRIIWLTTTNIKRKIKKMKFNEVVRGGGVWGGRMEGDRAWVRAKGKGI